MRGMTILTSYPVFCVFVPSVLLFTPSASVPARLGLYLCGAAVMYVVASVMIWRGFHRSDLSTSIEDAAPPEDLLEARDLLFEPGTIDWRYSTVESDGAGSNQRAYTSVGLLAGSSNVAVATGLVRAEGPPIGGSVAVVIVSQHHNNTLLVTRSISQSRPLKTCTVQYSEARQSAELLSWHQEHASTSFSFADTPAIRKAMNRYGTEVKEAANTASLFDSITGWPRWILAKEHTIPPQSRNSKSPAPTSAS